METITPGDVVTHKKKKRKGVPNTSVTQEEESPLRQKKKKKDKRRLSAECAETIDLGEEEEVGRSQEPEPPAQEASQHKKKKKRKSDIVVNDENEVEEVTVVEPTSTNKKKKRKSDIVVIDENEVEEVTVLEPTSTNKKKKKKKKQKTGTVEKCDESDVITAIEANTSPAELGGDRPEREPTADGVQLAAVPSHQGKRKRKRNMEERGDSQEPRGDLDFLKELMSYVPDIASRSPEIIAKMLRQDLPRFREFRKKGIELRWGRFLKVENLKIQENVGNFLALTGIETANQLFFPERYPGEMESIKKLRVLHSFLDKIAEDIPRPCFKVYTRAKKIFDDLNYLGRFTAEENIQLQKMQRLYGNNWKTIARGMDRSVFSIQKRFSMIATSSGPWSHEEVDRLVEAMKEHLERLARKNQPDGEDAGSSPQPLWLTKRQLHCQLPWKSISEKVTGRSWIQCREKWFSILKPKMVLQRPKHRGARCAMPKIKLINVLYAMDLEDAAEIDWERVANGLGNVTPFTAQKMFNLLKMTRVPHSATLSFCELIDFLHDKVVPMLQEKMKDDSFHLENENEEVVQQRYMLSDIIPLDQFMELDNTARAI